MTWRSCRGAVRSVSADDFGLRYVLLRREFRTPSQSRTVATRARRLLVAFGGADPVGMTLRTTVALENLSPALRRDLHVRIVVGAANPAWAALEGAASKSSIKVTLEREVGDMSALMKWADLAVSSGGITIWELAKSGCPTLVIETSPAERLLARGLGRVGLFDPLGDAERGQAFRGPRAEELESQRLDARLTRLAHLAV